MRARCRPPGGWQDARTRGRAQATEVDDASEAHRCGSSPEAFSQLAVTSAKVFGTQRVHEIESDLASS